jgi:hypothetical protein
MVWHARMALTTLLARDAAAGEAAAAQQPTVAMNSYIDAFRQQSRQPLNTSIVDEEGWVLQLVQGQAHVTTPAGDTDLLEATRLHPMKYW